MDLFVDLRWRCRIKSIEMLSKWHGIGTLDLLLSLVKLAKDILCIFCCWYLCWINDVTQMKKEKKIKFCLENIQIEARARILYTAETCTHLMHNNVCFEIGSHSDVTQNIVFSNEVIWFVFSFYYIQTIWIYHSWQIAKLCLQLLIRKFHLSFGFVRCCFANGVRP